MGIARGIGRAVKALRRKSSNRLMGNRNKQGDLLTVDQQIEDLQRDVKMLEEDYFDYAQDKGFDVDTPSVENPDEFWSQGEGFQVISDIEELMQKSTDQEISRVKKTITFEKDNQKKYREGIKKLYNEGTNGDNPARGMDDSEIFQSYKMDDQFKDRIKELAGELEDLEMSKSHHKDMLEASNYQYFKDAWTTAEQRKKGKVSITKDSPDQEFITEDDIPY